MDDHFPKAFLSWLLLCIGGGYAALCVMDVYTFAQPPVFLSVLAIYSIITGLLWWMKRVLWWAMLPAILGVVFVAVVGLVVLNLELTGPPY